jgi:hypothetical protein
MKLAPIGSTAAILVFGTIALAAAGSIPAHQAQASACRAAFTRARAQASEPQARSDASRREEECLVDANDGVLPFLSGIAGDAVDFPNAVQTYRDAAAALCGVLAEKTTDLEGPGLARTQCVAERESELGQLIDGYAAGGQLPNSITTSLTSCDEDFKAKKGGTDVAAWTTLATCASEGAKAKASAFVPKFADGDPLGTLSHSPEQVASTFTGAIGAGNGVCEALVATQKGSRDAARARCRAGVAANVVKAVVDRLR